MNEKTKAYVISLLDSYQICSKQIDIYHYELSHHSDITNDDTIEALALAHGEDGIRTIGHISDKTLYIALNYQEKTRRLNQKSRTEIADKLVKLEAQKTGWITMYRFWSPARPRLLRCSFLRGIPSRNVRNCWDSPPAPCVGTKKTRSTS